MWKSKYPIIALTGGMGCGKSAASGAFAELGALVFDADKICRNALENNGEVKEKVKKLLGENAYDPSGLPRREEIAKIVFADSDKLDGLEKILHPLVDEFIATDERVIKRNAICIIEVPLLFEKNLEKIFDACISVICSDVLRKQRLMQRGLSESEITRRDAVQMPPVEKAKRADIVLFNESDRDFLKKQAAVIISRFQ